MQLIKDEKKVAEIRLEVDVYFMDQETGDGFYLEWEEIPEELKEELLKCYHNMEKCYQQFELSKPKLKKIYQPAK